MGRGEISGLVMRTEREEREKVNEERERMIAKGVVSLSCARHVMGWVDLRFSILPFFFFSWVEKCWTQQFGSIWLSSSFPGIFYHFSRIFS